MNCASIVSVRASARRRNEPSGAPFTSTCPESAGCSPASVRRSVLLPQPFGPHNAVMRPAPMVRSSPSSTT
ncbi:hypothetical protein BG61_13655 [Caballeronia glathei]|uniref:Uncharacterized protein n=1 Tax=Caballeronia glathei TaxID=60547 RepID=A0A069PXB4_9BURK|nr:hypothetical protein BG61_13655 [Caballeronia glathei]